jgi:dTDP-4-amino-4,6-dideoxygalactose transaminase
MAIPLFDTATPLAPLQAELRVAIERVLASGRYILGPEVREFETEFAQYVGADHAIGVANGTDALTIALRAMGVGPGDEVVVPSFTFYATAEAVAPTGARPVFCDIDPATFCVTPETVKPALSPRTKAVIAVHLFGNVAPVAAIEALGVPVLEDAAQAAGSLGPDGRPGALGAAATFSFYPSKNLGAFGDGGAITTNDAGIAARADASIPRLARQADLRRARLQLTPRRAAGGDPAGAAAPPRRMGRWATRSGAALRGIGDRRARDAADGERRLATSVAPLCGS